MLPSCPPTYRCQVAEWRALRFAIQACDTWSAVLPLGRRAAAIEDFLDRNWVLDAYCDTAQRLSKPSTHRDGVRRSPEEMWGS